MVSSPSSTDLTDQERILWSLSRDELRDTGLLDGCGRLGIGESTVLLARIDLHGAAAAYERENFEQTVEECGLDEDGVRSLLGQELIDLELLADQLRERRRQLVSEWIADLEEQRGTAEFVQQVVWPLVRRVRLPKAIFKHGPGITRLPSPWRQPEMTLRELQVRARRRNVGPIAAIIAALNMSKMGDIAHWTASYLDMAYSVHLAYKGQRLAPVSVPLVLAALDHETGHFVRALVVPRPAQARSALADASLAPARQAVRSLIGRDPLPALPMSHEWGLCIADYDGGVAACDVDGSSAGLSIAAALAAGALGFPQRRSTFASAQITSSGEIRPLTKECPDIIEKEMGAKGKVLEHISARGSASLVVALGERIDLFRKDTLHGLTKFVEANSLASAISLLAETPFEGVGTTGGSVDVAPPGPGFSIPTSLVSVLARLQQPPPHRLILVSDSPSKSVVSPLTAAASRTNLSLLTFPARSLYQSVIIGRKRDGALSRYLTEQAPYDDDFQRSARQSWISAQLASGSLALIIEGLLTTDAAGNPSMGGHASAATDLLLSALLGEATSVVVPVEHGVPAWAESVLARHEFETLHVSEGDSIDDAHGSNA